MKNKKYYGLIVQAIYVFLTSLQLIFIPNTLLGMFGFEPTSEIWIKVFGVVLMSLGVVYYGIIKYGNAEVVTYTVYSRILVGIGFGLLVIAGVAPVTLILFAGIDVITAVWTWWELKRK